MRRFCQTLSLDCNILIVIVPGSSIVCSTEKQWKPHWCCCLCLGYILVSQYIDHNQVSVSGNNSSMPMWTFCLMAYKELQWHSYSAISMERYVQFCKLIRKNDQEVIIIPRMQSCSRVKTNHIILPCVGSFRRP